MNTLGGFEMKLQDRVAIVTGAGRGLGRAVSLTFSREGASVVLLSRTESEIRQVEQKIRSNKRKALAVPTDVSRAGEVDRAVQKTLEVFQKVDILVNNAAVIGPINRVEAIDPDEWQKTTDINLNGVFYACRAVLKDMKKRRWGKIINIGSGLGIIALPRLSAYSVTKAGVIHLTRVLAEELVEFNIQVNAIDPGLMDTRMQEEVRMISKEALSQELYKRFHGFKEKGELKDPEEIATLVVLLASDDSQTITGNFGGFEYYAKMMGIQ